MGFRTGHKNDHRFRSRVEQFPATKLGTVFGTVYRRMHSKTGIVLRLSH